MKGIVLTFNFSHDIQNQKVKKGEFAIYKSPFFYI